MSAGVKKPRSPQRRIHDGQTFYTVYSAAHVLGRSTRTLRRLEQAGIIERPTHQLPGARPDVRWYSEDDLKQLQGLVEVSGYGERRHGGGGRLKELLDGLGGEARTASKKTSWADEEVARTPRQLLGRRTQDEAEVAEWEPPSERQRREERRLEPVPPAVCCPRCQAELLWEALKLPGGATEQVPVCQVHGLVDLSEPEAPDPNRCHCGEELVWELGEDGFQPVCEHCGPVQVPAPARPRSEPVAEVPFVHVADFGVMVQAGPGRAGGLTQRDVRGAIRVARPQSGPRMVFIPPHPGATRPG